MSKTQSCGKMGINAHAKKIYHPKIIETLEKNISIRINP
jgi:hypothetical protein